MIRAVFDKVKAACPELNHKLGMREVFAEDLYPRVVWVPIRSLIGPPEGQGGDGVTGGTLQVAQHPLRTRNVDFDIHIWGESFTLAEQMMERFVSACLEVMPGSVEFTSEEWILPDGTLKKGEAVVLSMVVKQPLLERKQVITTPNLLQETSEMDFNGVVQIDHTVTG